MSGGRNLRSRSNPSKAGASRNTAAANVSRLYSEDAPGLRVDPVVVLVLSLVFIASVFALHIYGKLTRG
ncbi:hypothetical protein K493DRAFT_311353 [Basidiobolus meristosporus CBS 931.73]|uniref:Protein transport protein Sec61 subunit beta n=1 Tax=Basidiobolus meristosporus CBS 931.73 TaxID=1314790 RepID=A0A1Y1Y714_9FUNG|nr:hypothetical protein K493DRAFT_315803 [Basidiobolus meristosporus CBS 931.73]ORY04505.1 hypothetical protein K493DRAFT_311353 [Basidiobolus meristosporus CBS 931.73]|eukprot:ORX93802.1 hypothetical protein K493DRAFT_315803 [Basidiobolus meristosporus CBS 931.73]